MSISDRKKEFIDKCIEIHGDKYDYSLVEYKNNHEKILVICKVHGKFEVIPAHHKKGVDCAKCKGRSLTTEDVIKEAINVHGDKYIYDKLIYVNNSEKMIITCKIHGDFEQSRNNHVGKKHGCNICAEVSRKLTKSKPLDTFITESKNIYGDKYDYSKVIYSNNKTKVIIICKIHGEFLIPPAYHLFYNIGCPQCGQRIKLTYEIFMNKAIEIHGDKYDYSLVNPENICHTSKLDIICKIHGKFTQVAQHHIRDKSGCRKCGHISGNKKNTYTQEEFIIKAKEIHGNKYDYSKVIYKKSNEDIIILCNKGHEFSQKASYHLAGYGCMKCCNKSEGKLFEKVVIIYPTLKEQFKVSWCKKKTYLPFDFCIEEHKIIIEVDGNQHFTQVRDWASPEKQQETDLYKMKCANENGYSVIRIIQDYIYKDKYDWLNELINSIEKIINDKIVQNIYICKNEEYKVYQEF